MFSAYNFKSRRLILKLVYYYIDINLNLNKYFPITFIIKFATFLDEKKLKINFSFKKIM